MIDLDKLNSLRQKLAMLTPAELAEVDEHVEAIMARRKRIVTMKEQGV